MGKWNIDKKPVDGIKKYRIPIFVLLIGLVLLMLPDRNTNSQETTVIVPQNSNILTTEQRLEQILTNMAGAGEVRVMLTVASGEEIIYQTDEEYTDDGRLDRISTVTVSGTDRTQDGLIRSTTPPTYLGAIVVCTGAADPSVRLAVVEAVARVTGLGADCISVLKMK